MSSITNGWARSRRWGLILLLAATTLGRAQEAGKPAATAMMARFAPGQSLRYEFEGAVHVTTGHAQGVTLNVPEECSYRLRAVLTLDFEKVSAGGALGGRAYFQGVQYDGSACGVPPKVETRRALENLEASGITFEILPAGD